MTPMKIHRRYIEVKYTIKDTLNTYVIKDTLKRKTDMKIEIDYETANNVFCSVLKEQYQGLSPYIGRVPMFSGDKEENKRECKRYRDAFKLIAEYNGVKL